MGSSIGGGDDCACTTTQRNHRQISNINLKTPQDTDVHNILLDIEIYPLMINTFDLGSEITFRATHYK